MDKLKNHIERLRENFTKGTLNEAEVNKDPFLQFQLWLQQAVEAQIPEVQAMNLATVSVDMKPSSRIVYLREFENNNFSFYTNYNSKKAEDLKTNPNAAISFFGLSWKGRSELKALSKNEMLRKATLIITPGLMNLKLAHGRANKARH